MHPIATAVAMDPERSVIWLPADTVWSVFLGNIQQIDSLVVSIADITGHRRLHQLILFFRNNMDYWKIVVERAEVETTGESEGRGDDRNNNIIPQRPCIQSPQLSQWILNDPSSGCLQIQYGVFSLETSSRFSPS
jgi:hypothetical protein